MSSTEARQAGRVLVVTVEGTGEVRRLRDGASLTLGRSPQQSTWVLPDPGVPATLSRLHCRLALGPDGASVTDLGSTNGTQLDGRRIPAQVAVPLHGGEVLEIGPWRLAVAIADDAVGMDLPGLPSSLGPASDASRLPGQALAPTAAAPHAESDLFALAPGSRDAFDDPLAGAFSAALPAAPRSVPKPTRTAASPPQFEALPPRGASDPLTGAGDLLGPGASAAPPRDAGAVAALAAFLEGAGLEPDIATGRAPEVALREAGALFAAMAGGLRDLLAMRAAVKDHAGLERTQITAALNNPLKLSVSRREATAALLGPSEEGYLAPLPAVEAAFRDLTSHELAVLDGVQSAVEELLSLFEPQALERRLEDTGLLVALIQGGRRALLWELYQQRYGEIAGTARSRFMGRLDEAFRTAYVRKAAEVSGHAGPPPALTGKRRS